MQLSNCVNNPGRRCLREIGGKVLAAQFLAIQARLILWPF